LESTVPRPSAAAAPRTPRRAWPTSRSMFIEVSGACFSGCQRGCRESWGAPSPKSHSCEGYDDTPSAWGGRRAADWCNPGACPAYSMSPCSRASRPSFSLSRSKRSRRAAGVDGSPSTRMTSATSSQGKALSTRRVSRVSSSGVERLAQLHELVGTATWGVVGNERADLLDLLGGLPGGADLLGGLQGLAVQEVLEALPVRITPGHVRRLPTSPALVNPGPGAYLTATPANCGGALLVLGDRATT
jgi:hypothetical protein